MWQAFSDVSVECAAVIFSVEVLKQAAKCNEPRSAIGFCLALLLCVSKLYQIIY
jgi:hypothetical protein